MKSEVVCRQLVEILNSPIQKFELLVPLVASIWNMSTRPDNRQVWCLFFLFLLFLFSFFIAFFILTDILDFP
jgi:uncharacterized membrane protein